MSVSFAQHLMAVSLVMFNRNADEILFLPLMGGAEAVIYVGDYRGLTAFRPVFDPGETTDTDAATLRRDLKVAQNRLELKQLYSPKLAATGTMPYFLSSNGR
jgi:hypothetical protein